MLQVSIALVRLTHNRINTLLAYIRYGSCFFSYIILVTTLILIYGTNVKNSLPGILGSTRQTRNRNRNRNLILLPTVKNTARVRRNHGSYKATVDNERLMALGQFAERITNGISLMINRLEKPFSKTTELLCRCMTFFL